MTLENSIKLYLTVHLFRHFYVTHRLFNNHQHFWVSKKDCFDLIEKCRLNENENKVKIIKWFNDRSKCIFSLPL